MMIVMEWLSKVNEVRLGEMLARASPDDGAQHLPSEVATAMNIYRHEIIERMGGRYAERYEEWRGAARKVASGQRDRKKQAALYIGIKEDGVSFLSRPPQIRLSKKNSPVPRG